MLPELPAHDKGGGKKLRGALLNATTKRAQGNYSPLCGGVTRVEDVEIL
jgi:hypothetical protein